MRGLALMELEIWRELETGTVRVLGFSGRIT